METIRISSIIPISEANGPGPHYTIWTQGCNLKCSGCFNSHTHDPNGGYLQSIDALLKHIADLWHKNKIKGVTFTGGEPLQQIKSVITLLKGIKTIGKIGTIVLTGYNKQKCFELPEFNTVKEFTDVLIAGPYKQDLQLQEDLRGSSNKELILFTSFYSQGEFTCIPPVEVLIERNGSLSITGIKPEILTTIKDSNTFLNRRTVNPRFFDKNTAYK